MAVKASRLRDGEGVDGIPLLIASISQIRSGYWLSMTVSVSISVISVSLAITVVPGLRLASTQAGQRVR